VIAFQAGANLVGAVVRVGQQTLRSRR